MKTNLVLGVIEGIIATVIIIIATWLWRSWRTRRMAINDPEPNGFLRPAEKIFGVVAHPVEGTLKRLPNGYRIWLLVVADSKGKVWPQGFWPVQHNAEKGTWKGYVHVWGWNHVTITAVVAPPTSQDFFNYFQRMGNEFNSGYQPLNHIPAECKKRATVQAQVPKAEVHEPGPA